MAATPAGPPGDGPAPVPTVKVEQISDVDLQKLMKVLDTMKQQGIPPTDDKYRLLLRLLRVQYEKRQAPKKGAGVVDIGLLRGQARLIEVLKQNVKPTREQLTNAGIAVGADGSPVHPADLKTRVQAIMANAAVRPSAPSTAEPIAVFPLTRSPFRKVPANAALLELPSLTRLGWNFPQTLPHEALARERDRQSADRIELHKQHLRTCLAEAKGNAWQAEFELLALQLLPLQRQLRQHMTQEYMQSGNVSKRELNRMEKEMDREKYHLQQRQAKERQAFLDAVANHRGTFVKHYKEIKATRGKVCKHVTGYLEQKRKEEERHLQEQEKERLRAIKENDEEQYMRLLVEAKSEKLATIINRTQSYMETLGTLVQRQKKDRGGPSRGRKLHGSSSDDEGGDDAPMFAPTAPAAPADKLGANMATSVQQMNKSRDHYYAMAHAVKEDITVQPSLLTGGNLKPYQMQGLQWLVSLYNNRVNGILADEMGLGKTIQTIALLSHLIEHKNCKGPFLIIVPLGTIANWQLEFAKWAPQISLVVYKGSKNLRNTLFNTVIKPLGFCALLTTYEYVTRDKAKLRSLKWNYIIIDEGHRIKNSKSKFATVLSENYHSKHRLLLTGTPLQNDLSELWSLLNFLLPTIFNSRDTFETWFSTPFAAIGDEVEFTFEEKYLIIKRLHDVLRPFLLRRLKKEVLSQLPEKTEYIVKVQLSELQSQVYNLMKSSTLQENERAKTFGTNTLIQMKKICDHPYLFPNFSLKEGDVVDDNIYRVSGKFELLDRILPKLKALNHRVLIFSQMTQAMDILGEYFDFRGYTFLRLDGTVNDEARARRVVQFNADDSPYFIFLLSTRAGGLGLNLQTADTVIFFDSDWNPHVDDQAMDRAHRIGQRSAVRVLRLVTTGTVEEHILERASYKRDIDNQVIQAGKFNQKSDAVERREVLEKILRQEDPEEGEEHEVEITVDSDINDMLSRTEGEVEVCERIDEEIARQQTKLGVSRFITKREADDLMQLHKEAFFEPEVEVKEMGRGQRERKEVDYADKMTEQQFLKQMESGSDEEDEVPAPARPTKRPHESDSDDLPGDEVKKGGKPVSVKPSPAKKKKAQAASNLPADRLVAILTLLADEVDPLTQEKMSKLFMVLPSKKIYPDYYQLITKPIDMKIIKKKATTGAYMTMAEFADDLNLLYKNAQQYNLPDSWIYVQSVKLQEMMTRAVDALTTELAAAPPPVPASTASTPARPSKKASAGVAPAPPTAGKKPKDPASKKSAAARLKAEAGAESDTSRTSGAKGKRKRGDSSELDD